MRGSPSKLNTNPRWKKNPEPDEPQQSFTQPAANPPEKKKKKKSKKKQKERRNPEKKEKKGRGDLT